MGDVGELASFGLRLGLGLGLVSSSELLGLGLILSKGHALVLLSEEHVGLNDAANLELC